MIALAALIEQFEADFLSAYHDGILPSQLKALAAMKICRTKHSPVMQVNCTDCEHQVFVPHSCGHRNCPHCQHHESQRWIERQAQKQVPARYFMITFTLPAQLRALAWQHQRVVYRLMFDCVWDTLQTFSQNDKKLKGDPGVIAVLHTHSRELNYHPHIHAVMPAACVDKLNRLWKTKQGNYLFNHKALAKVFRAKVLTQLTEDKLTLPRAVPQKWVVDCKQVGSGDKALVYLGRYLYRGVIREKDILSCQDGRVTYRFQNSKTKRFEIKTVSGVRFLWLILQHVLPKGFRRARNFGFLHPNSKQLIKVLHYVLKFDPIKLLAKLRQRPQLICDCCGGVMKIGRTRIPVVETLNRTPVLT